MTFLLMGMLLLPLAGSVLLLAGTALRRVSLTGARQVFLLCAAVATLCGLLLSGYSERDVHLPLTWLPGSGELSLHVGGAGTYAALATMAAALLAETFQRKRGRGAVPRSILECPPDSVLDAKSPTTLSGDQAADGLQTSALPNYDSSHYAIGLAALGAANASFLAGHFLGRYVALEVVGLCVALAALSIGRGNRMQRAWHVYLLLRLGDAGMLTAILALFSAGGTLAIAEALHVGGQLPPGPLAWVVGGFVLAVAVKTGVWPFQSWMKVALPDPTEAQEAPLVYTWLYPVVMPNLGLYLLYRITPLLLLSPAIRAFTLTLAVLPLGAIVGRWRRHGLPVAANAVLGALGLLLAAGPQTMSGLESALIPLLLIATPLRLLLWGSLLWSSRYPLWRERLAWSPLSSEHAGNMQNGLAGAARSLQQNVEHGLLEQGLRHATRSLRGGAHLLHHVVEEEGLEGLLRALARGTLAASRTLQSYHTGQLRHNVGWVTLAMLLTVALLVSLGWR